MLKIRKALISVSDKSELLPLVKLLKEAQVEIISTGGTRKLLEESGIPCTPIEKITGNPEAFQGRMKTISFQIGSALLYKREDFVQVEEAMSLNIPTIDLVVCNLYPFERELEKKAQLDVLVENIDIGGPTMLRAAAKNFNSVAVLSDPAQYPVFCEKFKEQKLDLDYRKNLSYEAFVHTACYDAMVARGLHGAFKREDLPPTLLDPRKSQKLRYGENPHQQAYKVSSSLEKQGLSRAVQLQGKAMSYNNWEDADHALKAVMDLDYLINNENSQKAGHEHGVVVVKHGNPCGMAMGQNQKDTLEKAFDGDRVSSFGGIIAFNSKVEAAAAQFFRDKFVEVILAPSFDEEAKNILGKKKNLRLLEVAKNTQADRFQVRSVDGGYLMQEKDLRYFHEFQQVTKLPTPAFLENILDFGILASKNLKSNAICLVWEKDHTFQLIGAGMGNPNRLLSLKEACALAKKNGVEDLSSVLLVSDAFFPFSDSIEAAHRQGLRHLVQPGGSIRDRDVIEKCDELKMSMTFTGTRHFKH